MAKNWAVVIGINDYNPLNFTPLNCARTDAEKVGAFFSAQGFEQVYLFTDQSPRITLPSGMTVPSDPTYGNLVSFLEDRFQPGVLTAGDTCWFFFAGHGERHADKDYLMPKDANSRGTKVISGLRVDEVREWLTRSGAGTVILLLDACRSLGSRDGRGIDPTEQPGIITISSCNPTEKAWEIEDLGQGAFTYALLEALQLPGESSCATVERLGNYLKHRVPELCRRYRKPIQTPRVSVDPIEKQHFILMPQFARQDDIERMKAEGFRLMAFNKLPLAEQMFLRANAAAQGRDPEIIKALVEVYRRLEGTTVTLPTPAPTEPSTARSSTAETISISDVAERTVTDSRSWLQTFSFKVVGVDAQGKVIRRESKQARYFAEDLGNGITLEMVQIPGGTFWMGQTEAEKQELIRQVGEEKYQQWYARELPRHQVTISPFFMGKFPVTQAQYEAVMGENQVTEYDRDRFVAPDKPVVSVSWHDAVAFCDRLSQQTGRTYRLPSEAEWEYACRAGTETPFHFGETITPNLANYDGNYTYGDAPKGEYREQTNPVGRFPANAFGLFDLHGNVWEWCLDYWHDNYQGAPTDGSVWNVEGGGNWRVIRGGSWFNYPWFCRSASRYFNVPDGVYSNIGFRVVCGVP